MKYQRNKATELRRAQRNLLALSGFKWKRAPKIHGFNNSRVWHAWQEKYRYDRHQAETFIEVDINDNLTDLAELIEFYENN